MAVTQVGAARVNNTAQAEGTQDAAEAAGPAGAQTLPNQRGASTSSRSSASAGLAQEIARWCADLPDVDPQRVADKTRAGLPPGATADQAAGLAVQCAAELIGEEPQYSRLAARLLSTVIAREAASQGATSFSTAIAVGHREGLIGDVTAALISEAAPRFDAAIDPDGDLRFEYFGLRTVYDRYLLRHPVTRRVIETPQHFLLRVAAGLSQESEEAIGFYRLMSSLAYLPSSPTLFNSGTRHTQMSSCYLVDSPRDDLDSIYARYHQVARLSKFAGGIGLGFSRVRSRGALIRSTNGRSNGIVPFLRTLDSSVAAVNQGGRRKGAACVYLEPWHPDIEEFLQLRDNTGEDARRTHNLNLANWIPDEFMRRVEEDGVWSLMDPDQVPELPDLWGAEFDAAYRKAEAEGRYVRQISARELYGKMMRTLAQTGNGWMTFKDASNKLCNQTGQPGNTVHLSNLCTEIIEVSTDAETAVCNLGSVNLAAHLTPDRDAVDWDRLRATVRTAVVFLDRVIDINYYPSEQTAASNPRWRPVGLGLMGLQDVFFALRLPFDDPRARELSTRVAEEIYLTALETSAGLAEQFGAHPAFADTRAAKGFLQPDLWGTATSPELAARWDEVRGRIGAAGLRNSLLVAIAPTATIASIAGCYECIEPQVSNLFKRETLSGEFLQVNTALVGELKARGLWTPAVREAIKRAEGSVQDVAELPAEIKALYRTAWELPQRALIDLAAARGPFIDQSQSLNLFLAAPTIGKLSSMYMYAWKAGLKSTYYLRSRPATRIAQATVAVATVPAPAASDEAIVIADDEAIACSLENPEACEACQ